jgi:hypothetical protein
MSKHDSERCHMTCASLHNPQHEPSCRLRYMDPGVFVLPRLHIKRLLGSSLCSCSLWVTYWLEAPSLLGAPNTSPLSASPAKMWEVHYRLFRQEPLCQQVKWAIGPTDCYVSITLTSIATLPTVDA